MQVICYRLQAVVLFFVLIATQIAMGDLIVNGNFEAGNSGFSNGHLFAPGDIASVGGYDVVNDPADVQNFAASFGDHTTGTGLMMAINGASDEGVLVWSQTVTVNPNTDYEFSGWAASWDPSPPLILAELQIKINNVVIGTSTAPLPVGVWEEFTAGWSSDSNISASIEIFNLETSAPGNDFALDDLSFSIIPEPTSSSIAAMVIVPLLLSRRIKRVH